MLLGKRRHFRFTRTAGNCIFLSSLLFHEGLEICNTTSWGSGANVNNEVRTVVEFLGLMLISRLLFQPVLGMTAVIIFGFKQPNFSVWILFIKPNFIVYKENCSVNAHIMAF